MGSYSSGNIYKFAYTYVYCNASSSVEGDYPNIKQRISWEVGIYCSGNSTHNYNTKEIKINGGTVWSGTFNVGNGYHVLASGSYTVGFGNNYKVSNKFTWSYYDSSGEATFSDSFSTPSVWQVDSSSDVGVDSAKVKTTINNVKGYWRYYLYCTKTGQSWYTSNPQSASATLTLSDLKVYTDYTITMRVIDRNGNVVLQNSASASFKTLGYSTATVSSSSVYVNNKITINTNRFSDSFTHTISWALGTASGTVGTGIEASIDWTLPTDSMLSAMPNVLSATCTLTTQTYNGSTLIGTTTTTFTVTIPSEYIPSVSSCNVTELNSLISAKTNSTVRYLSNKKVVVKASASQGSSISKVQVTYGSNTQEVANDSTGTYTFSFSNITSGDLSVTVLDVRTRTVTEEFKQEYIEYDYPKITELNASREQQTSDSGTLSYKATYSTVLDNTITSAILEKTNEADVDLAGKASSGNLQGTITYTDKLLHQLSYEFRLTIIDSFNQRTSASFNLGLGEPTLWLGKKEVRINDTLIVGGVEWNALMYTLAGMLEEQGYQVLLLDANDNYLADESGNAILVNFFYKEGA